MDKPSSFLQMIRRDRRGRLKIYLGYAPGVGKTRQMLEEAHRLKAEGIDVVLGAVETRGRADVEALRAGLDAVAPRALEYRGLRVEEMDLEAVLARRPQVALVDELEHSNVPGGRNSRRYQDVEDLLAAGINVIAALNVHHLESLCDTVEQAAGVKVRDRIPDAALAEADQVVNVDVSPEDLLKRLAAGRIRASRADEGLFQPAALEQLRELTLREAASQIDLRRRETRGGDGAETTDQVMVCLDARGAENTSLLRYGSRLAGRLNRNWYAVHVQPLDAGPADASSGPLSDTWAFANRLGATVFTLKANDAAEALARFAREYRVGHVIVGRPRPRPLWKFWAPGDRVVRRLQAKADPFALIIVDARRGSPSASHPGGDKIRLTECLAPAAIKIWEEPLTKERAMRELVDSVANPGDKDDWIAKLREREAQGSTFLNEGLALPHARIEGLDKPLVALGLSRAGILDASTENAIEAVFLLLSPRDGHRPHLQLLAVAGRMMQNRILRNRLRAARDARSAFAALSDFENPA